MPLSECGSPKKESLFARDYCISVYSNDKSEHCTGQPIKMVALGGSITKGHGPIVYENSWTDRFFSWVNATFPHSGHELINHAIPAVSILSCWWICWRLQTFGDFLFLSQGDWRLCSTGHLARVVKGFSLKLWRAINGKVLRYSSFIGGIKLFRICPMALLEVFRCYPLFQVVSLFL